MFSNIGVVGAGAREVQFPRQSAIILKKFYCMQDAKKLSIQ